MIDWLTFTAPLLHQQGVGGPFFNGDICSTVPDLTHPDGEMLDWTVRKRLPVEGSYSTQITVKSMNDENGLPALWVSGNPAKWFQGHNVFGSDDLPGLVVEMLNRICASRGVNPHPSDLAAWAAGAIKLHRVDVTESFDLATTARVRNALRSLDATANLKHRGRGQFRGDSLCWGGKTANKAGSRRWSLTLYAKGPEMLVHPLPTALLETSLPALAAGLLRAEVRLLGLQLTTEKLDWVCLWGDNTAAELHQRFIAGLEIAGATMIEAQTLDGLSGRLQLAYTSWREGHDLRAILPRKTFYRYRLELLKHGIDIGVKQERTGPDLSNVVPIGVVLNAYPVRVPDWAVGTPLYFEPRAKFG